MVNLPTLIPFGFLWSSSKKKTRDRDMTPMPRYETTHLLCSFWSRLLASVVSCLSVSLFRAGRKRKGHRETTDTADSVLASFLFPVCRAVNSCLLSLRARGERRGDRREGTYRHWDETAGIEKEGRKIRLVPGGYIPTQETKQKECWK